MVPRHVLQKEEECRVAHRDSSRRSYQKHRNVINQRRRETYHAEKPQRKAQSCLEPLIRRAARNIDIEVNAGETHTQVGFRRSSELAEVLNQLERLRRRFDMLTENSPRRFVSKVYHSYVDTIGPTRLKGDRRVIEKALTRLSPIEKLGYGYEHIVLNTAGVGKEMERVYNILEPIHQLIFWLEDLLCETMNGPEELQARYNSKDIAFCSDDI
ncbi:uncharacterized protein ARMOST_09783 [Armillaria ostoyae]|uniref:Uncharacterized protein n=1 Tax=Armillaria ostoyae TaxID=47428 RepID=A0A284RCF5_ARMOS|nr:uncharacterized protein ARMOST_09783 [Armillaria ostoyae]